MAAGLTPYVCIGETLEEREANKTEAVIEQQINAVLNGLTVQQLAKCVFAYEPVWAIGTGRTPTTNEIAEVHSHIRKFLYENFDYDGYAIRILYGGSVNAKNISLFSSISDINGFLVGGASQSSKKFIDIVKNYYK